MVGIVPYLPTRGTVVRLCDNAVAGIVNLNGRPVPATVVEPGPIVNDYCDHDSLLFLPAWAGLIIRALLAVLGHPSRHLHGSQRGPTFAVAIGLGQRLDG